MRDLPPTDRKDYFSKIENAFQKSREYGDDKVQLAVQTYEMVSIYLLIIFGHFNTPIHKKAGFSVIIY